MSRWTDRRPARSDAGFTLVEVMVALGVLVVLLTALLPQLVVGIRSTATAQTITQAKGVAQGQLERMRSMPYHVGRAAGPYLDVLDRYFTNLAPAPAIICESGGKYLAPSTSWSGYVADASRCDYEPRSGPFYRYVVPHPATGPDPFAGFEVVVATQFLDGDTPPGVVTPVAPYDTQTAGRDRPASSQIGVTVTVLQPRGGTVRPVTTYTQIADLPEGGRPGPGVRGRDRDRDRVRARRPGRRLARSGSARPQRLVGVREQRGGRPRVGVRGSGHRRSAVGRRRNRDRPVDGDARGGRGRLPADAGLLGIQSARPRGHLGGLRPADRGLCDQPDAGAGDRHRVDLRHRRSGEAPTAVAAPRPPRPDGDLGHCLGHRSDHVVRSGHHRPVRLRPLLRVPPHHAARRPHLPVDGRGLRAQQCQHDRAVPDLLRSERRRPGRPRARLGALRGERSGPHRRGTGGRLPGSRPLPRRLGPGLVRRSRGHHPVDDPGPARGRRPLRGRRR